MSIIMGGGQLEFEYEDGYIVMYKIFGSTKITRPEWKMWVGDFLKAFNKSVNI